MPRAHAVAASALLLLTGCSSVARPEADTASIPQLGWADSDARKVALPDGPFLQGDLGEVGKGEPVLINFWASTCAPCVKEMPLLQELADDGVTVVGVTRDRFDDYALRAIRKAGVTYPNLKDFDGDYMASYDGLVPMAAIPSSVVVVDGRVARVHIGPFHSAQDLDEIRDLASS